MTWTRCIVVAFALVLSAAAHAASGTPRPNIVLIVADDHGLDALG
jgi:hypothetical protein